MQYYPLLFLHICGYYSSGSFLCVFQEILLYGYWGVVYVLHVSHYHSAHFSHSDCVESPSVVTVASCFDESMVPHPHTGWLL